MSDPSIQGSVSISVSIAPPSVADTGSLNLGFPGPVHTPACDSYGGDSQLGGQDIGSQAKHLLKQDENNIKRDLVKMLDDVLHEQIDDLKSGDTKDAKAAGDAVKNIAQKLMEMSKNSADQQHIDDNQGMQNYDNAADQKNPADNQGVQDYNNAANQENPADNQAVQNYDNAAQPQNFNYNNGISDCNERKADNLIDTLLKHDDNQKLGDVSDEALLKLAADLPKLPPELRDKVEKLINKALEDKMAKHPDDKANIATVAVVTMAASGADKDKFKDVLDKALTDDDQSGSKGD